MKQLYKIQDRLKILNGACGIRFDLGSDVKWATENRALWGAADSFVSTGVHCILCDLATDAVALLTKAKLWIEIALDQREKARHFGEQSRRFHLRTYAIILWLIQSLHDQNIFDHWLAEALPCFRNQPDTSDFGFSSVTFVNAGAHRDFIALAAPGGIDSIKCSGANERQMALTLAAQALTQKFPEDKLAAAVKKFLDNNVGKWLNDGHAVRAAEWMKVIYWKRGEVGISPFDAVRKCLDHVER